MRRWFLSLACALCLALPSGAQSSDFVTGADLGWITEYEHKGYTFTDTLGRPREATDLIRDYGMKAVRIRVWVNPVKHGNWCSKEDALNKALRAKALGMDVMLDFHYSDWWCDPQKQPIPAAWQGMSYEQMRQAVADHTREVLTFLKGYGVMPRWVQVGNETTHGLLWSVVTDPATGWEVKDSLGRTTVTDDMARAETHPERYAGIIRAGYDAVKVVLPQATVIVHLDDGFDQKLYDWNLGILRRYGAKFDMVGMSLYPYWATEGGKQRTADETITHCMDNIRHVARKFGCDVMIVETGMDALAPDEGYRQLCRVLREARTKTDGRCRGVFYWEPECKPSQYRLGAFTEGGRPTRIMQAFNDCR